MNAPNGIPRMPGLDPAMVDRGMNPVDPAQGAVNYLRTDQETQTHDDLSTKSGKSHWSLSPTTSRA